MVDVSVFLNPIEQTNALADALRRLGFTTRVWRTQNYMMHPCIVITCGPGRHLSYPTEYVYAAPEFNGDGRFWFWGRIPMTRSLWSKSRRSRMSQLQPICWHAPSRCLGSKP
jgi:hypothetical protein